MLFASGRDLYESAMTTRSADRTTTYEISDVAGKILATRLRGDLTEVRARIRAAYGPDVVEVEVDCGDHAETWVYADQDDADHDATGCAPYLVRCSYHLAAT